MKLTLGSCRDLGSTERSIQDPNSIRNGLTLALFRHIVYVFGPIVLALAGWMSTSHAGTPPKPPNIVIVIADDQGWNDIGYHNAKVLTPHLDRLANSGVRLEAHYVSPTCSPTRVGLLSGRSPSRFGILGPIAGDSRKSLPTETETLADVLKSIGYRTAITGKWHLGLRTESGPRQYGFDATYGALHGQVDPYTHRYKFGDRTWHRNDEPVDEVGHATDLITREAIRIIESDDERPFFLYVAYSVPHYPLDEPEKWTSMYANDVDEPSRGRYLASLTHMDEGIGRIVDALDATGARQNTLFVFLSDNGGQESWSAPSTQYEGRYPPDPVLGDNRPYRGWKGELYEGGIRVPALVNWPGRITPRVDDSPVCVLDWYPTIAEMTGVRVKDEWRLDGTSILRQLTDTDARPPAPRKFYWHTGGQTALRIGDWKLIQNHRQGESHELFNLADDPFETINRSNDQPDELAKLKAEMKRERRRDGTPNMNPRLQRLMPNRWLKLHEQTVGDEVRFDRQEHGGSCFDSQRGQLVLFGSNTHGKNWYNSPFIFDPVGERWSQPYPHDPRSSYRVNGAGIGVAGPRGGHPWAMHTFGAVIYDPVRDEVLVASAPQHMIPGRFTDSVKDLWSQVNIFPTWTFNVDLRHWQPLMCEPVSFFPFCAAYDDDRQVVIGHRSDGIYELSGEPRQWKRLTDRVFHSGWHTNCVYDSKHEALVVFGTNTNSNDIEVYFPANGEHRVMPTPGARPPEDQHNPMAFVPPLGQVAVLVDQKTPSGQSAGRAVTSTTTTETWLYDVSADAWTHVAEASLPFGCGMNYNLDYDPRHECLLLVTGGQHPEVGRATGATTVWALRLE